MSNPCDLLLQDDTVFARRGPSGHVVHWREARLCRRSEVVSVLDDMRALLWGLGHSARDCSAVRLAVEEALVNGLCHGNRNDPTKRVQVRYWADHEAVVIEVEDEGPGFDADCVADPTLPANLDRPGGRGLLLMRYYMTWVRFSGRGNRVTLCKRRSPSDARSR